MQPRSKTRSWWLIFGSLILVVAVVSCTDLPRRPPFPGPNFPESVRLADQIPGRDLRRDPPRIESMQVKMLSSGTRDGNALMMIRPAKEEVPLRQLIVEDEGRRVVLRDDGQGGDERAGDGILSGAFRLDVARLERNQRRFLQAARTNGGQLMIPVFNQREKIGERPIRVAEVLGRRGDFIDLSDFDFGIAAAVDQEKSLLIRNPAVVGDPTRTYDPCGSLTGSPGDPLKKWSFGYLMQEMYNNSSPPLTPSDFTLHWMGQWTAVQVPNNLPIAARNAANIGVVDKLINPWLAASGGSTLDLRKAPFKLVAIVNRVDLADNPVYGGGNGGELRFVFGAVDTRGGGCQLLPFTAIFEFGVPKSGCTNVRSWAQQWQALSALDPATEAYRAALEALTEQVVRRGLGGVAKPNGSALNQLRTNDFTLASPWELREFRLQGDHLLHTTTVAQTPALQLDQTTNLRDYINNNQAAILAGSHNVPLTFPTFLFAFRGGASPVPNNFWNATGINPGDVRHKFSLSTCNGCHRAETGTPFLHIDPQVSPAGLSGFLTGGAPNPIDDPATGAPSRSFSDLEDRAANLDAVANNQCIFFLGQAPMLELRTPDFFRTRESPGSKLIALPTLPRTRMVH